MDNGNNKRSFWSTLPGILTGIAAVITAIATLYISLNSGVFNEIKPTPTLTSTPLLKEDALREADGLASEWLVAFENKDIASVIEMADVPFYFDKEILVSIQDVREMYLNIFSKMQMEGEEFPPTSYLKAKTVSELKSEGYDVNRDRILSSLRLTDNDIAVTIIWEDGEGLMLVFRRVNGDIEMAGFWD